MSKDTQEFLDDLLHKLHGYDKGEVDILDGQIESTVQAILQHFQQEQEKKPVRSIPIPFPSLYATDKEYLNAKEAYDKKVEEQWAGAERLYTQSEVDRLIREAVEREAYWSLANLELIKGGTFNEGMVYKNQLDRLKAISEELSKQEGSR